MVLVLYALQEHPQNMFKKLSGALWELSPVSRTETLHNG
jgi:hypothetical protein